GTCRNPGWRTAPSPRVEWRARAHSGRPSAPGQKGRSTAPRRRTQNGWRTTSSRPGYLLVLTPTNQDDVRLLSRSFDQTSQHIMENAAVPEVIQLVFRIYADFCLERPLGAVGISNVHRDDLPRKQAGHSRDRDRFRARKAQRFPGNALRELQRKHAHADQVGT